MWHRRNKLHSCNLTKKEAFQVSLNVRLGLTLCPSSLSNFARDFFVSGKSAHPRPKESPCIPTYGVRRLWCTNWQGCLYVSSLFKTIAVRWNILNNVNRNSVFIVFNLLHLMTFPIFPILQVHLDKCLNYGKDCACTSHMDRNWFAGNTPMLLILKYMAGAISYL